MIQNLAFNLQEIFEEIVEQGIAEGVASEEAYHQLVDDTLEEHRRIQELNDDQNLTGYQTQLNARWPEYRAQLNAQD